MSPVFSSADELVIHIAVVTVARMIQRVFGTVIAAGAVVMISALLMWFEKISLDRVAVFGEVEHRMRVHRGVQGSQGTRKPLVYMGGIVEHRFTISSPKSLVITQIWVLWID
jgi:hypothetical protein